MAIQQHEHHQENQSFLLDAFYCQEHQWDEDADEDEERENRDNNNLLLLEQDLFWEDDEIFSLLSREKQTHLYLDNAQKDPSLCVARKEAVGWMLKVKTHHGFSALTAILAVNYLDRFLSSTLHFQKDKPWVIQLAAVTCLSIAAKVEETQVPLLLDLQVEDSKYLFEAKTIQRMEILVMSSLQWRMNPVTPISYLDHIMRRLGLKTHLHWDFFRRCEGLLLSAVADWRFGRYLPSVIATATMLHVIHQVEPSNFIEYQNQLLDVLKTSEETVNECYKAIVEVSKSWFNGEKKAQKRMLEEIPSGVMDTTFSGDENDLWAGAVAVDVVASPSPLLKKIRVQLQYPFSLSTP